MPSKGSILHPLAVLPAAIWGGTWIALKISHLHGIEFAFFRAFGGGLLLFLIALAMRRPLGIPRPLVPTMIFMSLTIGGFFGFAFAGGERLSSALGSLLGNIAPVSTVILAALLLGERPTARQYAGVALAFAGIVVIALPHLGAAGDLGAIGLMLAGAVSQSFNTIYMKRAIALDQLVVNAYQFMGGGVIVCLAVWATGELQPIPATLPVAGSLLYVAVFATALANLLWSRALTLLTASAASMIIFMVPIFGHLWSWAILHEPVDPFEVAGAVLVIAGMVTASFALGRDRRPVAAHVRP